MPEHIRALIVILGLSAFVFYYLREPATKIIGIRSFNYRRNLWIAVTLIAFLSHNFWVYACLTWLAIFITSRTDTAKVALFLFLLFAVPGSGLKIPGLGLVNYLFVLNHQRLLVISILLPAFLKLFLSGSQKRSDDRAIDRLLIVYILLTIVMYFRGTTFTDALRFALEQFLDIYVPYYVVIYSIRNIDDFKNTMFSYVVAVLILSMIGLFEIVRHWHLYAALSHQFGLNVGLDPYLQRAGLLRASASLSKIPLGYVIAIGIGFHLFLKPYFPSKRTWNICLILLLAGLISPLSRGPWVGAVVLILTVVFFSKRRSGALFKLIGASVVFAIVIGLSPLGKTMLGLVPFVGDIESGNITYRQELLKNSWVVIKRNPWFGSIDYLKTPEMEEMRQGQGIIDIVNSYLVVTLKNGFVGLALFIGIFVSAGWKVYRRFRSHRTIDDEKNELGKVLFATLISIMIMISTVSSVSAIPIMYWVTIGLCSAYINIIDEKKAESRDNFISTQTEAKAIQLDSKPEL